MAGTAGIQNPVIVRFSQSAVGAANNDYTLTRAGTVVNAWNVSRATDAGATCTISRVRAGAVVAISDAMAATPDTTVTVATNIVDTANAVIAGDAIRIATAGGAGAEFCDAFVVIMPPLADLTTI